MLEDKTELHKTQTPAQNDDSGLDDEVLKAQDFLEKIGNSDLYTIGKLWIDILETGLLGTKCRSPTMVPIVEASPPRPPPPKMKYTDLPVYTSPHNEYKDYLEDTNKSSEAKRRIMHEYLLPHVSSFRKNVQQNSRDIYNEIKYTKESAVDAVREKKNNFKEYMRDDRNLLLRQAVLTLGGVTGYYVGAKRGRIIPRVFWATVGLLTTGSLCFPKKTDRAFRNITYGTGKIIIAMYNGYFGTSFAFKERIKSDLSPALPSRNPSLCSLKNRNE